jgi:hypothetical protein
MPPGTGKKRKSLARIAAEISAEHDGCVAAIKRSLDHAMQAGDLLIEAKARLVHGK